MNTRTVLCASVLVMLTTLVACSKKQTVTPILKTIQKTDRIVRFELYTDQDFSTDQNTITFSLIIKNGSKVYFDSALAPMKVSAVPGVANKIVVEKQIPNDNNDLTAGFTYMIDNVGYSWHLEPIAAGTSFSTINYPFR